MSEVSEIPIREKNIVLIGFMGVGKTTVGQLVAKKLYRDFIDIDKEIEKIYGMPITEIFKKVGEAEFRRVEKEFIVNICNHQTLKIISLGGGAYLQEEVRKACLSKCIVYFLDLSWESWKERLPLIIDSRPVLQNKTLHEIEDLFFKRRRAYSLHNSKISTNNMDAETIANNIVESIKFAWDIYQPQGE
ncbi:shikimate kinase [Polycladomyces subterraneus]|uniref:Shikimate kinase n=1 Tax=Polycladomyces subterraneus TaxID=1016997 RepID=A0ABT8ILN1_9BACL|nr:shikimate kinase [Polycladomyces subterraneus]MDN4593312.1 shikimate kinase [Polycladomyces subterraneus]